MGFEEGEVWRKKRGRRRREEGTKGDKTNSLQGRGGVAYIIISFNYKVYYFCGRSLVQKQRFIIKFSRFMLRFRGWDDNLQLYLPYCNLISIGRPYWLAYPPCFLDFLKYERIADAQREVASQRLSLVADLTCYFGLQCLSSCAL